MLESRVFKRVGLGSAHYGVLNVLCLERKPMTPCGTVAATHVKSAPHKTLKGDLGSSAIPNAQPVWKISSHTSAGRAPESLKGYLGSMAC